MVESASMNVANPVGSTLSLISMVGNTVTARLLSGYAAEIFGPDLELPRLIILADSDHDDLAATLPEWAAIFDHDASALATRDSQNDFVAYF
jgi:hypothetical protein